MNLYMKILIAIILAGVGAGGYYGYTKYQETQAIQKAQELEGKKLPNRINEGTLTKGIY